MLTILIDKLMGWLARTLKWNVPPEDPPVIIPPQTPNTPNPPESTPTEPILTPSAKLDVFFKAIREFEGWYVGSASFKNHNPGNLRCPPLNHLAVRCSPSNFCVFPDNATGERAQKEGLLNTAKAKPPAPYNGEMTLQQFFERRDPPGDHNNPTEYAVFVAKRMGVDKDTWRMKGLLG